MNLKMEHEKQMMQMHDDACNSQIQMDHEKQMIHVIKRTCSIGEAWCLNKSCYKAYNSSYSYYKAP